MAKNCPYCQTELPDDAAFCYGCGKPQPSSQEEAPRRLPRWVSLLLVACILLGGIAVWHMSRTTSFLGTYELDYTAEDKVTYHLTLSFGAPEDACESTSVPAGQPVSSYLYVTDAEGRSAVPAFAALVEDVSVTAVPAAGAAVAQLSETGHDEQVWNCVAYNDADTGSNILRWELEMHSGDTLIVSHKVDYTK